MNTRAREKCICPKGYVKFHGVMSAYCATDSRKPCKLTTDCPKGEHCISNDGENWFCTGRHTGCYFLPEYPDLKICVD